MPNYHSKCEIRGPRKGTRLQPTVTLHCKSDSLSNLHIFVIAADFFTNGFVGPILDW